MVIESTTRDLFGPFVCLYIYSIIRNLYYNYENTVYRYINLQYGYSVH